MQKNDRHINNAQLIFDDAYTSHVVDPFKKQEHHSRNGCLFYQILIESEFPLYDSTADTAIKRFLYTALCQ